MDALKKSPFYSHGTAVPPFWSQIGPEFESRPDVILFVLSASSIFHWNNPVQSALLFGIGNFFFFLITYGDYTVLSLFAYLALALLFVAGVYANGTLLRAYLKKENYENPFSYAAQTPYREPDSTMMRKLNMPLNNVWFSFSPFS